MEDDFRQTGFCRKKSENRSCLSTIQMRSEVVLSSKKLMDNTLKCIICGFVFLFFIIASNSWWYPKEIKLSLTYISEHDTRLFIASDCDGDFFQKEHLSGSSFVLPRQKNAKKITLTVPLVKTRVRGFYLETPADSRGLLVTSICIREAKKKHDVKIPGEIVSFNHSASIRPGKICFPAGRNTKILLVFADKLRGYDSVNPLRFTIALTAALLLALLFAYKIPIKCNLSALPLLLFAVGATGLMVLPVINMDYRSKVSSENRFFQSFPRIFDDKGMNWKFPEQAEGFLNDRFYLREEMIELNNVLFSGAWLNIFHQGVKNSPKAVQTEDYWMFAKTYNSVEMAQNKNRFTDDELKRCAEQMTACAAALEKKFGVRVYFLLLPDKEAVYEEFYPEFLLKQRRNPESRLCQLSNYLKKNSDLNVIAPLPQMLKAKSQGLLYYKTGTHLTMYGSYIAALEIQRALKRDYPALASVSSHILRWKKQKKADVDIAGLMGYKNPMKELPESILIYDVPVFSSSYKVKRIADITSLSLFIYHYSAAKSRGLKAIVISDSFWLSINKFMVPVISEQYHAFFGNGKNFSFEPLKHKLITFKPEVVIIESTERFLHRFLTLKYEE